MYEINVEERPELRLAALAHIGPYMEIGTKFGALGKAITAAHLWPQIEAMVAVSYDDPKVVPEAELRSHAGAILKPGVQIPEGVEEVMLPAGRYATTVHKGPYHLLPEAYGAIDGEWLSQSAEAGSGGACYEVYLNDPSNTAADELLTAIYVPLK